MIAASFMPGRWKKILLTHGPLHLPFHFGVFALSGILAFGSERSLSKRILLGTLLIGLAFTLEDVQRVIYTIHFEWRDFVADAAGVLAALFFTSLRSSARYVTPCKTR